MEKMLKPFLPFLVVITAAFGLVYLTAQQNYRQGANDPQIQIAEDIAEQVSQGQNPLYFLPPGRVDIAKSLATYVFLFNADGKLLATSSILDGKNPVIPNGVLEKIKEKGEVRFTWEPKDKVRSAVVGVSYKGKNPGYVLVGRSIREVEKREEQLGFTVFIAWIVTVAATYFSLKLLNKTK